MNRTTQGRLALISILLSAAMLAWVIYYWNPDYRDQAALDIQARPMGGDFELVSYAGPVKLKQFRGKVVVLYFGYTQCPDICPTSLGYLSLALNALREDEVADIQGLFVSVDPERDTLAHLKEYGEYFHSSILGITGSPDAIDSVVASYGAAYRKVESNSAMGYLVDHSADTYLIDRQGRLANVLAHGTPPTEVARALRTLLAQP